MKRVFWTIVLYVALGACFSQLVAGALMYFGWEANANNTPIGFNLGEVRWTEVSTADGVINVGVIFHQTPGTFGIIELSSESNWVSTMYGSESRLWTLPRGAIRSVAYASKDSWRIEAAGWPCLSSYHYYEHDSSIVFSSPADTLRKELGTTFGGIQVPTEFESYYARSMRTDVGEVTGPSGPRYFRAIPYLPAWPGLAVNTVFYALLLWAIMHPRFFWRPFAKKAGHCRKCG